MLNVGSNFTGVGAWEIALRNKKIDYDLKFFSEIDPAATTAYCAIHNVDESLNIGDITKIIGHEVEDIDLFVYSPPCQAFSVAGNQLGFEDMRGVLFFDSIRIIKNKRPSICLMENVKGLTGKKFDTEFKLMLKSLENLGYNNYWKVMNLKNYGLPQNRERLFIVSIRSDIDDGKFKFPEPYDTGLRLKDFLEPNVDKKYYISEDKTKKLIESLKEKQLKNQSLVQINRGNLQVKSDDICSCLDANYWKGLDNHAARTGILTDNSNECDCIGRLENVNGHDYLKRVYSPEGCCPTVTTVTGGNQEIKILEPNNMSIEIWKDILDFEGCYQISSLGNVKSLDRVITTKFNVQQNMKGRLLKPKLSKDGYYQINLQYNGKSKHLRVHRLVAVAFIPNELNLPVVNHIDGNKLNNNVCNLEWCTPLDNNIHRRDVLRKHGGKDGVPRGVKWNKEKNIWDSFITIDNKSKFLGYFYKKEDAYSAYWFAFLERFQYEPWDIGKYEEESKTIIKKLSIQNHEPKILEDFYANRETREYDECPTLRADRQGLKVVEGIQYSRKGIPKLTDTCNTLTAQDPSRTLGNYNPIVGVLEQNEPDKVNGCSLRTRNYIDQPQQLEVRNDELSNSITTVTKDAMAFEEPQYRIRKLVPKECWRLQGFSDDDFNKAKQVLNDKFHKGKDRSDSSLYRMAGNSIGVTNIEALYDMLQPYFDKIISLKNS